MSVDLDRRFPLLQSWTSRRDSKTLKSIPWAMIAPHEAQALANHYQTLKRLAERGGLSSSEAVAVLEGRQWKPIPDADGALRLLVAAFEREHYAP